jgi:SAM-dependent methyltransferase
MSGVVALRKAAAVEGCIDKTRFAWLLESLARNYFLPSPPEDSIFVGDGDFHAIGIEFLRHFVEIGGLTPAARVLDVGCGIGRMAVPLTQYLEDRATYDGFDPVVDGIAWCAEAITPHYPRFAFHHVDLVHPLYNPGGAISLGGGTTLPFEAGGFDFAIMVSVATHLRPRDIAAYAKEIVRLLSPGGRLFLTAFVMDEAAQKAGEGRDPRRAFRRIGEGPAWTADPAAPLGSVAFDDGFIEARLAAAGLALVAKSPGNWRGGPAAHYQDIFVAEKPGRGA